MNRQKIITSMSLAVLTTTATSFAMKSINFDDLPVFDMEEYAVVYEQVEFTPQFSFKSPNFSYFNVPELPKGDLILALDFIDRYRQSTVPGKHKWAGLLNFPMIDSSERGMIKWLCLYMYDDVMYGYDPSPRDEEASRIVTTTVMGPMTVQNDMNMFMEMNRRFVVPVQYEDRENASVLFKFAESYVEAVSPGSQTDLMMEGIFLGYEFLEEEFMDGFSVETPPGRIGPVVSSQQGKEPEELVRLVYQFYQDPNPGMSADPTMGPDDDFLRMDWRFDLDLSLKNIDKELGGLNIHDDIELAQKLISPRWSQKLTFHYKKGLLLWNLDNASSVLLFNIGNKLYAYSPRYGVWKTQATSSDLEDLAVLKTKLQYPGIDYVERIELIPN